MGRRRRNRSREGIDLMSDIDDIAQFPVNFFHLGRMVTRYMDAIQKEIKTTSTMHNRYTHIKSSLISMSVVEGEGYHPAEGGGGRRREEGGTFAARKRQVFATNCQSNSFVSASNLEEGQMNKKYKLEGKVN
jgi:hypothetical protein